MMRLEGLSPDILPLTNAANSTLQGSNIIPDLTPLESIPLKPSPIDDISLDSNSVATDTQLPNKPDSEEVVIGRGDLLLQWGRKKRSRGARAESRIKGEEELASLHLRQPMVKVRRRSAIVAAQKVAAVSMPPPSVRRPSLGGRNSVGRMIRTTEDRSVAPDRSVTPARSDNRSSQSPANKSQKTSCNAFTSDCNTMNPDSKQPSDQETKEMTMSTTERVSLDKFEWPRIYLSLSRKEKEEDFFAMKGTKLPHRPKKRSKNVDKSLQYCFPGMWLSDLTKSRYEVREKRCGRKAQKVKGLKGMESMESDSE